MTDNDTIYNPPKYERQTTIAYTAADKFVYISTNIKRDMKRLNKLSKKYPDDYYCSFVNVYGGSYQCMTKHLNFSVPRIQTEAQKKRRAEILKSNRNKNKEPF
jgi:hypothetical protein